MLDLECVAESAEQTLERLERYAATLHGQPSAPAIEPIAAPVETPVEVDAPAEIEASEPVEPQTVGPQTVELACAAAEPGWDHTDMLDAIAGHVWRWQIATAREAERTLAPVEFLDAEIAAHFFTVALGNLLRAVEWGRSYCDHVDDAERASALADALRAFDDAAPDAKHVLDARAQVGAIDSASSDCTLEEVPSPLAIWWEREDSNVVVNVGGFKVDIIWTVLSAETLAEVALDALAGVPQSDEA